MTKRDSWIPPVLSFVTCGVYYFYWQYVTTEELKRSTGRDDLNPMLDMLLTIFLCGLYGVYVQYRNAQVIHEAFGRASAQHEDRSSFILILNLLAYFNGVTAFIAMMLLQDEYNKLADLSGGAGPAPHAF
ncbi:MAG: DUF4234 domain-containing protein [Sandaracinaceae bacterium]